MNNISWVAIPRSMQDESFYTDSNCVHVLVHIMLNISRKDHVYNGILVNKGQYLTSRKVIAEKTNIQESKVERTLKLLKKLGYIEQQTTNKYRLISIALEDFNSIFEQQVNNRRTADEQQVNNRRTQSTSNTGKQVNKDNTISSLGSAFCLETIWISYPSHRKNNKSKLTTFWKNNFLDGKINEIEKGLKHFLVSDEWSADNGKYIPGIFKFIEEEQYLSTPKIDEYYNQFMDLSLLEFKQKLDNQDFGSVESPKYDFSAVDATFED